MHILSSLLLNGLNAPFYQSLIESNLGNNFSPGTGYDDSTREAVFSVGLQGIKEEDIPRIDKLIFETLEKVAREGFSQERIDGVLHQVEIKQRHVCVNFLCLNFFIILSEVKLLLFSSDRIFWETIRFLSSRSDWL